MKDPLGNFILITPEGIGAAILEVGDVRDSLINHIGKTLQNPACIYQSKSVEITRYYFQFFLSTVFMCIVSKKNGEWYLENTLFNPGKEITENILVSKELLYARQ